MIKVAASRTICAGGDQLRSNSSRPACDQKHPRPAVVWFRGSLFFFLQAEDGIRDHCVTGVQTCALPISPEAFDRLTSVNLRGSFFTAQAAARIMIDMHIPGRIILMASVTGIQAHMNLGGYGITKAGIGMLAKSIALEVGTYGITANAISARASLTERTLQDDPEYERHWASVTPAGRVGYVEDIVAAALYLASPEARHVTGHNLVVDGGWTLQSPLPAGQPDLPTYSSQLR